MARVETQTIAPYDATRRSVVESMIGDPSMIKDARFVPIARDAALSMYAQFLTNVLIPEQNIPEYVERTREGMITDPSRIVSISQGIFDMVDKQAELVTSKV